MSADKSKDRNSSFNSKYSSANLTPCISVMKLFRDQTNESG